MSLRSAVLSAQKTKLDLPIGALVLEHLDDLGSDACPGDRDLVEAIRARDENLRIWLADRPEFHVHSLAAYLKACPLLVHAALCQFRLPNQGTQYRATREQNAWNVMPLDEQFETARAALQHYPELEDAAAALGLIKGAFARLLSSAWRHQVQRPLASRPSVVARKMRARQDIVDRHSAWAVGLQQSESLRDYAKREGISLYTAHYRSKTVGVPAGGPGRPDPDGPNFSNIWEEDPEACRPHTTMWWAARHWGITQTRKKWYADGSCRDVATLDLYWTGKVKRALYKLGLVPVRRGRQWLWYRPQDLKQQDLEAIASSRPFQKAR